MFQDPSSAINGNGPPRYHEPATLHSNYHSNVSFNEIDITPKNDENVENVFTNKNSNHIRRPQNLSEINNPNQIYKSIDQMFQTSEFGGNQKMKSRQNLDVSKHVQKASMSDKERYD